MIAIARQRAPLLILFLWLGAIGAMVAAHAYRTHQPPIYDAFSYYEKARLVWENFASPHPISPLNVAPTFRPPGTVLMSYPLGFDPDFRGFYFRSAFLPILLIGLAALIIGYRREASSKENLALVGTAVLLTCLPTFYHFELSPGLTYSSWGLVDNFLGGVAALALACLARSVRDGAWNWLVGGALAGALCIMIKPAGVLLAALVAVVWFCLMLHTLAARTPGLARAPALRRFLWQAGALAAIEGLCLLAAMRSQYLSRGNLEYGTRAIVVMRNELNIHIEQLIPLVRDDIGFAVPAWMAVMLVATIVLGAKGRLAPTLRQEGIGWYVVLSLSVLAVGIWFWIFGSGGGTQVRYFDPFLMLSVVIAVPAYAGTLVRLPRAVLVPVALIMVLPALNIATLLALRNPPVQWQIRSGVNVTAGAEAPGLAPARDLVESFHDRHTSVIVYSTSVSFPDAMFSAVFQHYMASHPEGTRFGIHRPVDWQRPTTYRIRDILRADYLLNEPLPASADVNAAMSSVPVPTLEAEQTIFRAWASGLGSADGVDTVYRDDGLQLLRIRDSDRFADALYRFIAAHRWREIFLDANPPLWWSAADVDAAAQRAGARARGVRFGDDFEFSAVSVTAKATGADVGFWWAALKPDTTSDWSIFVHAIDASGKILLADGIALGPMRAPPPGLPYQFDEIFLDLPAGTAKIAVGFYRGGKTLAADRGDRDSDGHRLLLALPDKER